MDDQFHENFHHYINEITLTFNSSYFIHFTSPGFIHLHTQKNETILMRVFSLIILM